jgi:hypothetical protein
MKTEITVLMQREAQSPMTLMDRCTLDATSTADAARQYARLFADEEPRRATWIVYDRDYTQSTRVCDKHVVPALRDITEGDRVVAKLRDDAELTCEYRPPSDS